MRRSDGERTAALELAAEWLDWMSRSKGRAPATVQLYRMVVAEFIDAVDGRLGEVTPAAIERHLQRARWGRAMGNVAAASTQRRDAACLSSFYTFLVAREYVRSDPTVLVSTPEVRNVLPKPLSDELWCGLWGSDVVGVSDAITLGLGFFGGLRREELTRLRVRHVDIGGRRLVNFVRKGGGEDVLPLGSVLDVFEKRLPHLHPERLWPLLVDRVERRGGDDWLIGWTDLGRPRKRKRLDLLPGQLDPDNVNAWLERLCKHASVDHVHPHRLRHSCATNLIRAGVPLPIVSSVLNHSSINTTARYIKAGGDALASWMVNGW